MVGGVAGPPKRLRLMRKIQEKFFNLVINDVAEILRNFLEEKRTGLVRKIYLVLVINGLVLGGNWEFYAIRCVMGGY